MIFYALQIYRIEIVVDKIQVNRLISNKIHIYACKVHDILEIMKCYLEIACEINNLATQIKEINN